MSRVKCGYKITCTECPYRIKCALLDRELKIIQKKISNKKKDSFWYSATIARIGGYELSACGDIQVKHKERYYYGDDAISYAMKKGWGDKELKYFEFENNNWFEVFDKDGDSFVCDGDYDSALDNLVYYYFDREVKGE